MSGKPCIRGMRVTVGTIVGLLAAGRTEEEILKTYPYLEKEDLREALAYASLARAGNRSSARARMKILTDTNSMMYIGITYFS